MAIIVLALFTGIFIQSCENEKTISDEDKINYESKRTEPSDISIISSLIKKRNISKVNKTSLSKETNPQIDFDIDNSVSYFSNNIEIIIANQKRLNNNHNVAISFIKEKGKIKNGLIVKVSNVSENIKKIEYFNFKNIPKLTTIFNNNDQTFSYVLFNNKGNVKKTVNFSSKSYLTLNSLISIQNANAECDGQAIMDCITDAYSNHGWVSVWATVQSAVIPQTAVAIALACAVKNPC